MYGNENIFTSVGGAKADEAAGGGGGGGGGTEGRRRRCGGAEAEASGGGLRLGAKRSAGVGAEPKLWRTKRMTKPRNVARTNWNKECWNILAETNLNSI